MQLANALSLEWGGGHLYAGTLMSFDEIGNPAGMGSVVRLF